MRSDLILIIGSNGQLASAIKRINHSIKKKKNFKFLSRNELDLSTNITKNFKSILNKYEPSLVINCAAYTAVDKAEDEKELAMKVNGYSVGQIAEICSKNNVPFFHCSTDYVFDGKKNGLWKTTDKVNPFGVYGQSKLLGEKLIEDLREKNNNPKFFVMRVSWVFDPEGNNFVKTILKIILSGKTLKVVDDQIGAPTSAESIAKALLDLSEDAIDNINPINKRHNNFPWGTYHFQGRPVVSWYEFAVAIYNQLDEMNKIEKKTEVLPIKTIDYPTKSARPLNTALDCSKTEMELGLALPMWENELNACLKRILRK